MEQLAVEDIPVNLTHKDESQAAERWFAERQILPDPSPQSKNSNLTRRDVTVALYRLAGSPKVDLPATSPYADVAPSDPDYAAYIWARQNGITFGWADGKFHPEANLSTRSAVAFLYRYQRMVTPAPAPESSSLPSSSVPKNSSVPGDSPVRVSRSHWSDYERTDTAFWRESLWATQQFIWGYTDYDYRYAEGFSSDTVSSSEFSVMLYRMAHGGSRLG